MVESGTEPSEALQGAAAKRIELKLAVSQVEIAASAPSGEPRWREKLAHELDELQFALLHHIEEVEAADGLLPELTRTAPRLANQIAHVQGEHPTLTRLVSDTIGSVVNEEPVEKVREQVLETLMAIVRHRQKGADLVYEGYSVDIGGQ